MRTKDFDRLVSFQGIGSLGAGEDEGEDGADEEGSSGPGVAETWATDRPTEEASPRKRRGLGAILSGGAGKGKGEGEEVPSLPIESLVISDDDIEDD
jgi:cell cycle checkpoint protein